MTQKAFIRLLKNKGYSYEIEGDKIVVTNGRRAPDDHAIFEIRSIPSGVVFKNRGSVYLGKLTSLPPGVVFENRLNVELDSLISLHPGVEFRNGGRVWLESLTSLPPGVEFKNGEDVWLDSLISLHPGVEFKNRGDVYLRSITGNWFKYCKGNIEGIDPKRLLNVMIKQGVFER